MAEAVTASLDASLIRRAAQALPEIAAEWPPDVSSSGWRENLRFFLTAYAGGFLFFLILLS